MDVNTPSILSVLPIANRKGGRSLYFYNNSHHIAAAAAAAASGKAEKSAEEILHLDESNIKVDLSVNPLLTIYFVLPLFRREKKTSLLFMLPQLLKIQSSLYTKTGQWGFAKEVTWMSNLLVT